MHEIHEIGGYIELEHYHGEMLHRKGIKLDCGRSCLAYVIKAKKIKRIALPYFMCGSISELCKRYGVETEYYPVRLDLRPEAEALSMLKDGTWIYLMNYYGQLSDDEIEAYRKKFPRMIVDFSQSYFRKPVSGADTLYSCRKFFGVPDGGILFTDKELDEDIRQGFSRNNMIHLLGRYECDGSTYFKESVANNERLNGYPIFRMSKLTKNLLHSIDYDYVRDRRNENFSFLHHKLGKYNKLKLKEDTEGAFAYPLLINGGSSLRQRLIEQKIYVPTLWPNVLELDKEMLEYQLSNDLLPLPCDQRYGIEEMEYMVNKIYAGCAAL